MSSDEIVSYLYENDYPRLIRYLVTRQIPKEEAEDMAVDALLKLKQKYLDDGTIEDPVNATNMWFGIAKNYKREYWRKVLDEQWIRDYSGRELVNQNDLVDLDRADAPLYTPSQYRRREWRNKPEVKKRLVEYMKKYNVEHREEHAARQRKRREDPVVKWYHRAYYHRMMADPSRAEKERERKRQSSRKYDPIRNQDPKRQEMLKKAKRKYYDKIKADPVRYQLMLLSNRQRKLKRSQANAKSDES